MCAHLDAVHEYRNCLKPFELIVADSLELLKWIPSAERI